MAARRRRVLVDVGGSSAEARKQLREVRDEVRRLGREQAEARIDINERVAVAKIDKVQQRIERLKAQSASVDVDVKLAGAYAQLDRLNLRLDRLRAKRVNIDVDVSRGALERTAAGVGALDRGVQGLGRGFANIFHQVPIVGGLLESVIGGALSIATNLGGALTSLATEGIGALARMLGSTGALAAPLGAVVGQVVTLGLSLASMAAVAGGLIIILNAVLGAIIALSGALVALVASAAAAAAGLGALAIGFGAALIPAVAVGLALFTRFQAILKAHQAATQKAAQATQDHKTAEQQRKTALDESKRAHEQLTQATVEGNRAMAQSVMDLRDAELGLAESKLGVKDARLNLKEARNALRDFLSEAGASGPKLNELVKQFSNVEFNPGSARGLLAEAGGSTKDPLELQRRILAVQHAQLGIKEAINQTAHAEQTLSQATRTRANFVRQGINAYRPYRQALEAVHRADDRLAQAQARTSAAQRKYDQALKGLSATERGTLDRVNGIVDAFTRFAKILTDPIFRALNGVFDSLKGHAGDFEGALQQVGDAMAGVVTAIGRFLNEPRTLSAFKTMASGAADLVTQLGARAFTSFLRIMREVATAALPAVRAAARSVADWLDHIAGQPGRIHRAVGTLVEQFRVWARFAGAVARLVINLFSAAAPAGKSLASSMTRIVNRWADWIKQNPAKVREFFRNAVIRARQIAAGIKDAVLWLRDHLPKAAANAKEAFDAIWPVIKKIADAVKFVVENPIGGGENASGGGHESRTDSSTLLHGVKNTGAPVQDRIDAGLASLDLQISQNDRKEIEKILRALGYRGPFPTGSGNFTAPPPVHGPKRIVRTASFDGAHDRAGWVRALAAPVLNSLSAAAAPALQPAGATSGGGEFHAHITVPGGGSPDERVLLAKMAREAEKLGLVGG